MNAQLARAIGEERQKGAGKALVASRTRRKPPRLAHQGGDPVFLALLKHHGIPQPQVEYVFAKPRKWRFDFGWPIVWEDDSPVLVRVALEVQGGIWTQGRHTRGAALLKEHEKLNRAACLGWRILYRTPQNLCSMETIDLLREALG